MSDQELNVLGSSPLDEILGIPEVVKQIILACEDPACKPVPGAAQCQWCPAKATCTAHAQWVTARDLVEWENTAGLFEVLPEEGGVPAPEHLDSAQLAQVLERAKWFAAWLGQVEYEALRRISGGEEIPGYKAVRRNTREKFVDERAVLAYLQRIRADPGKCLNPAKLRTPAQVRRVIPKGAVAGLNEFVTRPPGRLTVAPVDDKRDAVVVFDLLSEEANDGKDD